MSGGVEVTLYGYSWRVLDLVDDQGVGKMGAVTLSTSEAQSLLLRFCIDVLFGLGLRADIVLMVALSALAEQFLLFLS